MKSSRMYCAAVPPAHVKYRSVTGSGCSCATAAPESNIARANTATTAMTLLPSTSFISRTSLDLGLRHSYIYVYSDFQSGTLPERGKGAAPFPLCMRQHDTSLT